MEGLRSMNVRGAIANLCQGSIDCIRFSNSKNRAFPSLLANFLIAVSGALSINDVERRFHQVFVLSELKGKKEDNSDRTVFFVYSEILNIHSANMDGSNEGEVVICPETEGISFSSFGAIPTPAAVPIVAAGEEPIRESTSASAAETTTAPAPSPAPTPAPSSNNHHGHQHPRGNRPDHSYYNRRSRRHIENENGEDNEEKDATPKPAYEM